MHPYSLILLPIVVLAAVWLWNRAVARGMSAVVMTIAAIVFALPWALASLMMSGVRLLPLFQTMVIFWPQFIMFGPLLYREPTGLVLPREWAVPLTVSFWLCAALVFGWLTSREARRPFGVVFAMATGFVMGLAYSIWLVVEFAGWKLLFEGP
jgi:hypothetical protein